jgi:hypothetical protein
MKGELHDRFHSENSYAYEYPSSVPAMSYEPLDLSDKVEREDIENQEGAIDLVQGMILDTISTAGQHFSIIMRSRNGQIIEVSDHKIIGEPEDALAEQIIPGETYHLLLMLRPRAMTLIGKQLDEPLLHGQVHTQKYLLREMRM